MWLSFFIVEIRNFIEIKMEKEKSLRKEHAKNALKILGVKKLSFWDVPSEELSQIPMLKITKYVEAELSSDDYEIIRRDKTRYWKFIKI